MGPLSGIRVLDTSTVGPASRAAALLADLGAEVVKIVPPADSGRIIPHAHAYSAGRGTVPVTVDLRHPDGPEVVLGIAASCDVVIEGMRPGVAARIGIGPDDVAKVNDAAVYAHLTGYGQEGPSAQRAGHDINYQSVTGALSNATPRADGRPPIPGATFADSAGGGMHAVLAICAALVQRARTGEAAVVDVSAVDGMLSLMSLTLDGWLATGAPTGPGTSVLDGRSACYDVYTCRDGRHVAVGAIETKFFRNLCRLVGDESLADLQYRHDQQDVLRTALTARFASRPRDEWVALLADADTCVTPVLDPAEVADDAHLLARETFATVVRDGHREFRQVGRVLAGSVRRSDEAAPVAGDPAVALAELGIHVDDITRWSAAGAIR